MTKNDTILEGELWFLTRGGGRYPQDRVWILAFRTPPARDLAIQLDSVTEG